MRVGYVGAYCTANFGDWAILVNNILDINADENVIFTYSDSFPHAAVNYHCAGRKIKFVEVKLTEQEEYVTPIIPFECMQYVCNEAELKCEINQLDVLCISGGGYLDDNWCSRTEKFIKVIVPAIIAQEMGKKVIFMAQGIGPIVDTKESMRFLFRYLADAHIAIRDDYCSKSYLLELGVNEEKIHLLPDDLFSINGTLINREEESEAKGKYITVVLHDGMEYIKENQAYFTEFAEKIKKRYDLDIVFLPFDLVWYGYDQSRYLNQLIATSSMVEYEKFLLIEEAYRLIENSELVLTGRYHAMILAQQVNTPCMVRLGISKGGRTYAYNKVYGALKNLFKGCMFEESFFMTTSWQKMFDFVEEHFNEIVANQKELYANPVVRKNREYLKNNRMQYIEQYIRGELI